MKNNILFTFIFIIQVTFAQNSRFINLNLNKNDNLICSINKTESLISPKGKYYHHPSHTNQDIQITFLYNDAKDKIYSWKILNYEHIHENCNKCNLEITNKSRNNIAILVKVDSLGRYIKIKNIFQVKQEIIDNITALEKSSNSDEKESLAKVKKIPEKIIADIEKDMIIFFRYYGLETKNSTTTFNTRRKNFPFCNLSPPFKTILNIDNSENKLTVNLDNTFDKSIAEDADYNIVKTNQNLEKIKSKYNLSVKEEYVFSKENFRILSAKIFATEINNFHDNGITDYQYVITQK